MTDTNTVPVAVIAGGGPAGALAAKVLSERGFAVRLYEAYPHPGDAKAASEKSKAYTISVSPRGQLALRRCGVDPLKDLDAGVVNEALVRHSNSSNGKPSVTKLKAEEGSVVIRRRDLAASLLRAAEEAGAEVHCGWRVHDVDFERREVKLTEGKDAGANAKTVGYDLLVGADGVRSQVRNRLSNHVNEKGGDFEIKAAEDTMEYQVATLPRPWKEIIEAKNVDSPPLATCPPAAVHTWSDPKSGGTSLSFPLRDSNDGPINKYLVCVIFPGGDLGRMQSSGFAGYTSALEGLFPNWTAESRLELARLLAEEDNVPNTGGVCIWSQALSHPESGVVLVGDAGHGMWPSLGQGCNVALESVSVLADAIEAVDGSVSSGAGCRNVDFSAEPHEAFVGAIALEYDGLRREDAHAAVDLTFEASGAKTRGAGGTRPSRSSSSSQSS